MNVFFIHLAFLFLWGPAAKENIAPEPEFKIISFEEFEVLTAADSDKLRIYNFWATWCAPCIREMPHFEAASAQDPDLELVFISMDDGRRPERVTSFIKRKEIQSPVYLLDDVDFNSWIDKVDQSWTGAIPATLFILPDGERIFHEGELEADELQKLIDQFKP
ncbi:Thiol-disulfide isomerase or thioredoxin [Cyclobacterium lianum]|uniref:Thiol-disulfide isomerase or thioredoxin n=1 Tax=Cyclobacterium lianum TaxID=388280 RepID=A0A1M7JYV7_9BACT|nr:TlpA family protein disulfide reductase [Cyclobacterium lianum]SHM58178.1 Thiol-disulfide isomerase or thioredoxin [Cyclobacterium lianum]